MRLAQGALPGSTTPIPANVFAQAVQQFGNAVAPDAMSAVPNIFRQAVPAQYRWLASAVAGDRTPLTEKNYSPQELAALAAVVARDQAKLPQRALDNTNAAIIQSQSASQLRAHADALRAGSAPALAHEAPAADYQHFADIAASDAAAAQARAARASRGVGAVGYSLPADYGSNYSHENGPNHIGPLTVGVKTGDPRTDTLANTLGQFVYKTLPDGSVVIDDNYSWRATPWSAPRSLSGAVTRTLAGDGEALPSYLLPDQQHGRPVHVTLPGNMFGFGRPR